MKGEDKAVPCASPSLSGVGSSLYVAKIDDIPEVSEQGGIFIPATVVLKPPGASQ